MAVSTMLPLGTAAPKFDLPDPLTDHEVSIDDVAGEKGLLVMFICNHCPYVQHIRHGLVELGIDYADSGIGMVAISANDPESHPSDGPEAMAVEAREFGYRFPYLFDETQEIAKSYTAMCTPDFFLFDSGRKLVYRGRFDEARPNTIGKVTGADLRAAMDAVLSDEPVSQDQSPSMGCSIKWRDGNAPAYFTG